MTISFASTLSEVRAEHRTDRYKTNSLIVRRGFPFHFETAATSLTIRLIPAHPKNAADLDFEFTVSVDEPWNGWTLTQSDEGRATLYIPPNALVGLYSVQDEDSQVAMAVIFNPFSEEDAVYMENEEAREEYVLNDMGRIWRGSHNSFSGMPWTFAQFRPTVLLAALDLLDAMPVEDRHDPIKVTRHLSAVLNNSDQDNGVLIGNWSGDYSGGVPPTAWTGSAEILKQYWKTRSPVPYAQCWVFSGVFTSVLRTLGIPSSSISNFNSAHETTKPYNRVVERFYNSQGELQQGRSQESIWNFHVWNMAWMIRPDLQKVAEDHGLDYNGWQVVDATPQEESVDLYQLGPAPLTGIKYGFNVDYDADFVIGEVNADVVHYWEVDGTGRYLPRWKDSRTVGKFISTKAVGRDERMDITLDYKFKEGTKEERRSFENRVSGHIEPAAELTGDVEFEIDCPPEVRVGEAVSLAINVTNNSNNVSNIHYNCVYRATDYTGEPLQTFGSDQGDLTVEAGEAGEVIIELLPEQYEFVLAKGMQTIHFNCSAKVQETGQAWSLEHLVRINGDDVLEVMTPESLELGEPQFVTAVINNITHMTLTNVLLRAEGEGLVNLKVIEVDDIEPGQSVEVGIELEPSDLGDKLLVTTLDTAELLDIARSVHVTVEDSSGEASLEHYLWEGVHSENMDDLVHIEGR